MQKRFSHRDCWTVLLMLLALSFDRAAQAGAVPLPPQATIVCLGLAIVAGGAAAVLMLVGAAADFREFHHRK